MALVKVEKNYLGFQIKNKLGRPSKYGKRIYGGYEYGENGLIIGPSEYGAFGYGGEEYAHAVDLAGIYQVRRERTKYLIKGEKETGKSYGRKSRFYIPKNPQSENQMARRGIFASGVSSYQALSEGEKASWKEKAEGLPLSGFNLFMREYLLA